MSISPERIVDRVEQALESHRKYVRAYLDSMPDPPGMERPTDEEFMAFFEAKLEEFPAMPLRFPALDREGLPVLDDGGQPIMETRVVSPWLAMLTLKRRDADGKATRKPLVDGGEELLARFERIATREGVA